MKINPQELELLYQGNAQESCLGCGLGWAFRRACWPRQGGKTADMRHYPGLGKDKGRTALLGAWGRVWYRFHGLFCTFKVPEHAPLSPADDRRPPVNARTVSPWRAKLGVRRARISQGRPRLGRSCGMRRKINKRTLMSPPNILVKSITKPKKDEWVRSR